MIDFVPATMAHVAALTPHIRAVEEREALMMGYPTAASALLTGWASCDAIAAVRGDEVIALMGVSPTPDDTLGSLWFMARDLDGEARRELLLSGRRIIDALAQGRKVFVLLAPDNLKSIRYLRWLGFEPALCGYPDMTAMELQCALPQ